MVTLCSNFGAQENKICHCFLFFPNYLPWSDGPDAMILFFWTLSFKPAFHSPLSPSSRGSLVPLCCLSLEWYHLHIWGCWYFSWKSWFQLVIQPAMCMRYSACKLNKWADNIQPWHIPFTILNQSVVPCPVLTVTFCPAYRFLRRQIRWSGIPISLRIFHSLLGSTQSKVLAYSMKQK